MRLMFLIAIASAAKNIRIANAYFVPDSQTVAMLVEARRRGVDVAIIVPGPMLDAKLVRRASRARWGPLLEAGARIYEYQPAMYHTKVMVVDDVWVVDSSRQTKRISANVSGLWGTQRISLNDNLLNRTSLAEIADAVRALTDKRRSALKAYA